MSERRWWLWEWLSGGDCVYDNGDVGGYRAKATEIQIAPLDSVVCERGTREWAVIQAMRGKWMTHPKVEPEGATMMDWEIVRYCGAHAYDRGWTELPAPWVPKAGDEVTWYRGKHHGTGTYVRSLVGSVSACRHEVSVDRSPLYVETVSRMEETNGK